MTSERRVQKGSIRTDSFFPAGPFDECVKGYQGPTRCTFICQDARDFFLQP